MSTDGLAGTPEFDAVRAIFEEADRRGSSMTGPGDDAAILADGTLLSVDTAIEGVHFRLEWVSPRVAGARAARAALSDLAAMGGAPVALLAALSGPDRDVLVEVGRGAREAARACGAELIGGDLAAAEGPATIGVTVVGTLGGAAPWLRSGAKPGDALFVTGALGGAAAAVAAWEGGSAPAPSARVAFESPEPRLGIVAALREHLAPRAAIDLSDGLAADAHHVARASGVGIVMDMAALPVADAATPALALEGGEDYELLLAAASRPGVEEEFRAATGVRLSRVGLVVEGEGVTLRSPDGSTRPLTGGYGHWTAG